MRDYIRSFRLRTLPLSVSGIILGTGLAVATTEINLHFYLVFFFALMTTLCLQILANLCNELGDFRKGTDESQTGREKYGLQAGRITEQQMKICIYTFVGLSVVFGSMLVFFSFGTLFSIPSIIFLGLGLAAIVGAITYTLGKHPYGYHGMGDLGVFLFFGLLSTMGAFYLQTETMTLRVVLAAIAISMPIIGVLNLNNIRDIENDIRYGKRTLAVRLGKTGSRVYQSVLLIGSMILFACIGAYYPLVFAPVFLHHIVYLFKHDGHELDRLLPILSITTLLIAFLAIL